MKYILKTTFPCIVKTSSESEYIGEFDTLEVENEELLQIYPTENGLPFCLNLMNPKDSKFASFFKKENKNYIILEKDNNVEIIKKEKLNFSGKICTISIGNSLVFETDSLKFNLPKPQGNYKIFKQKNYACVESNFDFFALDVFNGKLSHFSGDDINFQDGVLIVSKNFNDSLKRKRTAKYKFSDEIVLQESTFFYQESEFPVLPIKILESIVAKDFDYAYENLSENLKESVSKQNLDEFFGTITNFLPLSGNEYITISQNKKNFVTFSVENSKISDISVDKL